MDLRKRIPGNLRLAIKFFFVLCFNHMYDCFLRTNNTDGTVYYIESACDSVERGLSRMGGQCSKIYTQRAASGGLSRAIWTLHTTGRFLEFLQTVFVNDMPTTHHHGGICFC